MKKNSLLYLFVFALTVLVIAYAEYRSHTADAAGAPTRGSVNENGRILMKQGISSTAIVPGAFVKMLADGYIAACATPVTRIFGVAMTSAAIPAASGGNSVVIDTNLEHIWYYPLTMDATPTQTMIGMFCDASGSVTPEITSGSIVANYDVLQIMDVNIPDDKYDTARGVFVKINSAALQGFQ